MSVLDDLKAIHHRDSQDALGIAAKQADQLRFDYSDVDMSSIDFSRVRNIIVGGMGGSALAASFLTSWPKVSRPVEVWRSYGLPHYADSSTLFVASSYSGNTEETQSALAEAESRGCQIVIISSGGALVSRAGEKGYPLFQLPENYQPRMAMLFNYAALIQALSYSDFIDQGSLAEMHEVAGWLEQHISGLLPTVPTADNPAKQLALDIAGSSVVVYGGTELYPAAYKWKISFNENAKNVAWCGQLPEFNHNEFLGWTSHPEQKPYKIVELRSSIEHQRVQKRFEISDKLLSGKRPAPLVVDAQGETELQQLLWSVVMGDFVSLYVALLNGLDPTPVDIIEKLKRELADA